MPEEEKVVLETVNCLAAGDAADGLDYRIEAASGRPRPDMTERAQRDEDDARPQLSQGFRREAALAERTRPIPLREDVSFADQPAQRLQVLRLAQIKLAQLAVAGVVLLVADVGQVRRRDLHHIGAMFGQGAAQVGPANTRVKSSTRMPESGRSPSGSGSGGLSPILRQSPSVAARR